MKVEQFYNKNQFHLYGINNGVWCDILQSYNSVVVKIEKQNKNILGIDWDYSTTTSKHVYMFLEEYGNIKFYGVRNKRAYVNKLIKDGTIIYDENMR